jgi:hypothetical protein
MWNFGVQAVLVCTQEGLHNCFSSKQWMTFLLQGLELQQTLARADEIKVLTAMDSMEILRLFAAVTTVLAAIMVALNWSPRMTVWGFGVFIVASVAWMIDGWLEGKASLLIQNAVLLVVNITGIYRWLPRI